MSLVLAHPKPTRVKRKPLEESLRIMNLPERLYKCIRSYLAFSPRRIQSRQTLQPMSFITRAVVATANYKPLVRQDDPEDLAWRLNWMSSRHPPYPTLARDFSARTSDERVPYPPLRAMHIPASPIPPREF